MSKDKYDIEDDEIRIIQSPPRPSQDISRPSSSESASEESQVVASEKFDEVVLVPPRKSHKILKGCLIAFIVVVALLSGFALLAAHGCKKEHEFTAFEEAVAEIEDNKIVYTNEAGVSFPYTEITDTTIGTIKLQIFTPFNAVPELKVGAQALEDPDAVLIAQAADIRGDNHDIVGAFVLKGELLSTGSSKSGFCAIINGIPIIGVANATPYLEQAIESEGYFFRQYPLVVGNQVVENKLKSRSLRKALAELNGKTCIIMTDKRISLHDFSEVLVKLGVTNAIYLVGSTSFGFARNERGERTEFGEHIENPYAKVNYIVWK